MGDESRGSGRPGATEVLALPLPVSPTPSVRPTRFLWSRRRFRRHQVCAAQEGRGRGKHVLCARGTEELLGPLSPDSHRPGLGTRASPLQVSQRQHVWEMLHTELVISAPAWLPRLPGARPALPFFPFVASYVASARGLAKSVFSCQQKLCIICTNQSFVTLMVFSCHFKLVSGSLDCI